MRKRTTMLIAAVLILTLIFALTACGKKLTPYEDIIRFNWGVSLPSGCEEIYSIDDGASFHGDGLRYHILRCGNDSSASGIMWDDGGDYREMAESYLDQLSVPADKRPPYDDCIQTMRHEDLDTLIVLWDQTTHTFYVIEDFI